jgi:MarR family transcriptional regulator, lower aerobic nicotinate degradation pathway regulator
MKYELLQTLLPYLDTYERVYPKQQNPQHFAVWLARQSAAAGQVAPRHGPEENAQSESVEIGKLLVYLNRYAKNYAKKALEGSLLGGMDEFVYLAILLYEGALTKSELIHRNRHEKPTGMEIIRRLLTAGFVEQSDDPDDRRSKRLLITDAGKAVFGQVVERMDFVSELLTGNLNSAEKMLLLQILEKLEGFHQLILAKTKGGDFEETVRVVRSNA